MKRLITILCLSFFAAITTSAMNISQYMESLSGRSDYNRSELSSNEASQIRKNVEEIFNAAAQGKDNLYQGYEPNVLREDYIDITYSLYNDGFLKLKYYDQFQNDYEKMSKLKVPPNVDPKIFWKNQYLKIFDKLLTNMNSDPEKCAGVNQNATVRKCCQGLAKMSLHTSSARFLDPSKRSSGQKCDKQSDCQSGLCLKSEFSRPGICVTPKSCYELQTIGGDCSGNKPYCADGACTKIDKGNLGLNECKQTQSTCSSDTECCSNKCNNKKCVDNFICTNCVGSGAKPKAQESCCPGHYLAPNGKCRIIFRPLVPIAPKPQTSILKVIFNNIFISSAVASTSSDVCTGNSAVTAAQKDMIANKASECRAKFKTSGGELSDCLRSVDDLQASFCIDSEKNLVDEDQSQLDAKQSECVRIHPQNSSELKACLDEATRLANTQKESTDLKGENRYAEFKSKYNMPMVTAKTYSDARKCDFRAFNDNWKASSNTERNAELFLRSFEFTFSGDGTQDYWEESGKGNIFKRANKVARAFRKNRARLVSRTQAIDKEMTCKCVAIFGPSEFSKEKQDYFNKNCQAEAASLRSKLGTDIDISRGGNGKVAGESNIDGTSISNADKVTKDRARIEEIDKGALGLSHEKLLIEFLNLRAQAQVERFVDDESLEDELNSLSEFISGTNFEEVWKDKVENDTLVKDTPPGDSRMLYKWGFKYLGGLLALILIIVLAVAGAFLGPALIGSAILGGLGGAALGFILGSVIGGFGGKASPGAFDIKVVKGGKYNLLYKFDGFEKWYVGPRYSNKSSVPETRCDVFAKASSCLKSAYAFNDSNMKYLTSIPPMGHFIVDPKLPPFVNPALISTKGMPVYNKTWVQIMNDTVNEGVAYLKTTKPKGKVKKGYTITKKSFAKRDIMKEAIEKKYFIPMRGNISVKNFDMRSAITDAAVKYAMCKSLSSGDCALAGADEDDIGLGYLFESEEEAREWAEYTYEMHYIYSSVTKDTYMGYPLLGADVYFQAVAYNMKMVGSHAASRAQNYAKASDLYQQDWDIRARDYQSLGEATLGITPMSGQNLKYRPAFFEAFSGLDFSGETQIEGFSAKIDQGTKAGKFNASELSALAAGKRQAVRLNSDIQKAKEFDSSVAKNPEGKSRLSSLSTFGSGLFSNSAGGSTSGSGNTSGNDLAGFGINSNRNGSNQNSAGAGSGNGSSQGSAGGANSNGTGLSTGQFGVGAGTGFGDNSGTGSGFGQNYDGSSGYGYGDSAGTGSDGQRGGDNSNQLRDQGMSAGAADDLINALDKNQDQTIANEEDSLFNVVSKAYKRNYSRVLLRSSDFETNNIAPKKEMSTEEEKEVKALLEGN